MSPTARLHWIAVLLIATLLPACAAKRIALSDADRAGLRSLPAIHVVHYATPLPEVQPPAVNRRRAKVSLHDAPSGAEIQSNLGHYDPTYEVAQRFAGTLSKRAGLNNLKLSREAAPLPVVKDPASHKERYKNGAVLEVWIDRWGFHYTPIDWKTYTLTLSAKARLSRLEDGRVLWNTGDCGYAGSGAGYDDRIVLADLKSSDSRKAQAKIRQTVARIADECARQLMQDFAAGK